MASRILALVLAAGCLAPLLAQEPAAPAQDAGPRRRPRIPVVLSDALTHSGLTRCDGLQLVASRREPVRVATWNIRAGRTAPIEEIATEIRGMGADVIALQEVDVVARRTGWVDQPAALAEALGFHYAFAASIKWSDGDYGLAVLSRWPIVDIQRHRLDGAEAAEPRIVLEVSVCADGRVLRLFNHHADGRATSRERGLAVLRQIITPAVGSGIVVLGDFNDYADAPAVRGLLEAGLTDLGASADAGTTDHGRIDYLLTDAALSAAGVRVWRTERSDHHAVVADLLW
jgi:endonuclease/exonuclease/phosphatase family metal-dependent hydrolase